MTLYCVLSQGSGQSEPRYVIRLIYKYHTGQYNVWVNQSQFYTVLYMVAQFVYMIASVNIYHLWIFCQVKQGH